MAKNSASWQQPEYVAKGGHDVPGPHAMYTTEWIPSNTIDREVDDDGREMCLRGRGMWVKFYVFPPGLEQFGAVSVTKNRFTLADHKQVVILCESVGTEDRANLDLLLFGLARDWLMENGWNCPDINWC